MQYVFRRELLLLLRVVRSELRDIPEPPIFPDRIGLHGAQRPQLDGPAGGTPLVLSNSLSSNLGMWDGQVAALAQRGYQANARMVTTVDEMSQETINLKR